MEMVADESIVREGLREAANALTFEVGYRLKRLYPGKGQLLVGNEPEYEEYANAGHCQWQPAPDVFWNAVTGWYPEYGIYRQLKSGVRQIQWQGHEFLSYLLTVKGRHCDDELAWIIGPDQQTVEAFLTAIQQWSSELRDEVLVYDQGHWQKSKALHESIRSATFDNLVLPEDLKLEIQADFETFFSNETTYAQYSVPWKRGVLLYGDPGNGKTHTLKALINSLGVNALYVRSFMSRHGTEEEAISNVFERARAAKPCVLIFEDLDSLINDRNRSYFLNELDGFAANHGIFVVASTNHPERLDPAIIDRPSRFDRKYNFPLPNTELRREFLALRNPTMAPELQITEDELSEIAALAEGFSFAYLKELWLSSVMVWINGERRPGAMGTVMRSQIDFLRQQMTLTPEPPAATEEDTNGPMSPFEMMAAYRRHVREIGEDE